MAYDMWIETVVDPGGEDPHAITAAYNAQNHLTDVTGELAYDPDLPSDKRLVAEGEDWALEGLECHRKVAELSERFPTAVFALYTQETDPPQWWVTYIQVGLGYSARPTLVFPGFDATKVGELPRINPRKEP